jgi:hypothetical protein
MSKIAEYQKHAQTCLDLCEKLPIGERKALLEMADAWLRLAAEELSGEPSSNAQHLSEPR